MDLQKLQSYINQIADKIEAENQSSTVTAFDFGAYAVKIIEFTNDPTRKKPEIINFDIVQIDLELPDKDVFEKLLQSVKKRNINTETCIFTVSSSDSFARVIKMPLMEYDQLKTAVKFKLKKEVLFDINASYIDCSILSKDDKEQEVLVTIILSKHINRFYNILKRFSEKIMFASLSAFSIYSFLKTKYKNTDNVTVLDIGHSFTQMIIINRGEISFYRLVSMGVTTIADTIAKNIYKDAAASSVNQQKCLEYLQNFGLHKITRISESKVKVESESYELSENIEEELQETIENALRLFAQNIRLSIGYYKTQTKQTSVSKIVVCSGGSYIKGLLPFVEEQLSLPVTFEDTITMVDVTLDDPFRVEYLRKMKQQFITVFSCASLYLRKKRERLPNNLIPSELIFKPNHPFLKAVENPGLFFVPVGGIILVFCILISIYNSFVFSSIKSQITAVQKDRMKIAPIESEINRLNEEIDAFQKKSDIIKANLDDKLYLSQILLEINNKTPSGMGVLSFSFTRKTKSFVISGISLKTELTTKCANDYGTIPYLKDIRLTSSEVVNQNSVEDQYVKYQIEGKLADEKRAE